MASIIINRIILTTIIIPLINPFAVLAEEVTGSASIGLGVVNIDNPSAVYGRYNGITDDRTYLIGNLDVTADEGAYYLNFNVSNAGLDNRSFNAEAGEYGGFNIMLRHDELPYIISVDALTPFDGSGSDTLTLPAGFDRDPVVGGMSNLVDNLKGVDVELLRKTDSGAAKIPLTKRLALNLSVTDDKKTGVQPMGGGLGISGQFTSAAILPKPVDYSTEDLTAALSFNGEQGDWQFEYMQSTFNNKYDALVWDNPLEEPGGPAFPTTARLALEPDNRHQRYTLSGGYTLPRATRITALIERGKMTQDQDLLPYHFQETAPVPLPRSSAEVEIETTHAMLNVSLRPVNRLNINTKYRYYKSDNKTPIDLFLKVDNDTGSQVASNTSDALNNSSLDYTQNQLMLDGSYYIGNGTTARLGISRNIEEREDRAAKETTEDGFSAKLNSRLSPRTSLRLDYARLEREVKDYDEDRVYQAAHTQDYINSVAIIGERFDNHPDLRQFDIADRDREKYVASLNLMPDDAVTLDIVYSQRQDDYGKSALGLTSSENQSITLDAGYNPSQGLNLFAYITRDENSNELASRYFTSAGPPGTKLAQSQDSARNWTAKQDEAITTVGLGSRISLMNNQLLLQADLIHTDATTGNDFIAGATLAPLDALPDLNEKRDTLELSANYILRKHLTIGIGYQYERYQSDDWQTDAFDAATIMVDEILLLTGPATDYEAHVIFSTVNYTW